MKTVFLAIGLACVLSADTTIEAPRIGYVSSAEGVRRVSGIFGASQLSARLANNLRSPLVLPGTDFAVGANSAGELVRIDLRDGATLPLGISDVDSVVTSPSGEAILAITGQSLQVIASAGSRLAEFSIPGKPLLMAVADGGKTVAVTVAEADTEALYLFNEQGARRVFSRARIAALAFVPHSGDLVAAEGSGSINRLNADLQLTQLTTIEGTRALAVTADGSRVLAVAGQTIHAVAFGTGETSSVECPCTGTAAKPLDNSTFLLTSGEDGPMWIVDTSSGRLRVAFIPEAVNE